MDEKGQKPTTPAMPMQYPPGTVLSTLPMTGLFSRMACLDDVPDALKLV